MTHLITTTMQPGVVREVSDAEFVDLTRMKVVESEVPTELSDVPAGTPLVSAMQAGGAQEVQDGQEQEADGAGSASAASQ